MAGRAHVFQVVDLDRGGPHQPGRHPGRAGYARAGGIPPFLHQHVVLVEEIHALGVAHRFALEQAEFRLLEMPLVGVDVHLQLGPDEAVAAAVDQHLAAALDFAAAFVELDAVGLDHQIAPAQFGITLEHRYRIGLALHALGAHERRQQALVGRHELFFEPAAGLQAQTVRAHAGATGLRPDRHGRGTCAQREHRDDGLQRPAQSGGLGTFDAGRCGTGGAIAGNGFQGVVWQNGRLWCCLDTAPSRCRQGHEPRRSAGPPRSGFVESRGIILCHPAPATPQRAPPSKPAPP